MSNFIVIDTYNGVAPEICETIEGVRTFVEREISEYEEGYSRNSYVEGLSVRELGREIPVDVREQPDVLVFIDGQGLDNGFAATVNSNPPVFGESATAYVERVMRGG